MSRRGRDIRDRPRGISERCKMRACQVPESQDSVWSLTSTPWIAGKSINRVRREHRESLVNPAETVHVRNRCITMLNPSWVFRWDMDCPIHVPGIRVPSVPVMSGRILPGAMQATSSNSRVTGCGEPMSERTTLHVEGLAASHTAVMPGTGHYPAQEHPADGVQGDPFRAHLSGSKGSRMNKGCTSLTPGTPR
jgi:hypothetical protein